MLMSLSRYRAWMTGPARTQPCAELAEVTLIVDTADEGPGRWTVSVWLRIAGEWVTPLQRAYPRRPTWGQLAKAAPDLVQAEAVSIVVDAM